MDRRPPGNVDEVVRYYHKTESRWGYELFLGGPKHFGWYEPGERPSPFGRSLRGRAAYGTLRHLSCR